MYTETVGRQLLQVWQRYSGQAPLHADAFFTQLFYPLFYDDARALQWVANSPFAQPGTATPAARATRLTQLLREATAPGGPGLNASLAPGFAAAGTTAVTSGQSPTNSGTVPTMEAGYCAWLGAACGIGVAGGLSLGLVEDEVLWALWEGWPHYRALLTAYPTLKGNQVETWNGHWLTHRLSRNYAADAPFGGLAVAALLRPRASGTGVELPTCSWGSLVLGLAGHLPTTTAYVYGLGQTNTTLGFVQLDLLELRKLDALAESIGIDWPALRAHYPTRYRLADAVHTGRIGLAQLEPARVRATLETEAPAASSPALLHHQRCHLWLTAMLANYPNSPTSADALPLVEAADRLAQALARYARHEPGRDAGRAKTKYRQLAQRVFTDNPSLFVRHLAELLAASPQAADFESDFLASAVCTSELPFGRFHLFQSYLRLRYQAYLAR